MKQLRERAADSIWLGFLPNKRAPQMLGIFVAAPLLALLPALLFGLVYWRTRRRTALVAASAWVAYFLYEEAMRRRILCSGECNIRVDLLLLYPMLIVISLAAVVSTVRWWRGRRPGRG